MAPSFTLRLRESCAGWGRSMRGDNSSQAEYVYARTMQGGQDIFVFSFSGSVMDGKTQCNYKESTCSTVGGRCQQSCVRSTRDGTASKARTERTTANSLTYYHRFSSLPFPPPMPFTSTSTSSTRPSKSNTLTLISSYRIRYCCLTTVKIFRLPLSSQEMEMIHSQKEREARQITHFLECSGSKQPQTHSRKWLARTRTRFRVLRPLPYPPIFPTKRISHARL